MQAGASGLVVRSASLCQEQPHLTDDDKVLLVLT